MSKRAAAQQPSDKRPVGEGAVDQASLDGYGLEIFSERLTALLDEISAARSPNAGRFCGYCYHPLGSKQDVCPHCRRSTSKFKPTPRIPREVIQMHKLRRSREGLIVHGTAWGGLTLGVALSLVPLLLAGATWWSILAFFAILAFFYVLSVNLANTLGDALGYAWGESTLRKRWETFLPRREAERG